MNKKDYKAVLLRQHKRIFHTQDLAMLWGIANKNTLYTTITRYADRCILFPIQKSLYATVPLPELDPRAVAVAAMHRFAYVSCETVLTEAGLINHVIPTITIVSDQSRRFHIAGIDVRSRQLHDLFLFNPTGITRINGIPQATRERAIADILYFNPKTHFDAPIRWARVRAMQQAIGYPLIQRS